MTKRSPHLLLSGLLALSACAGAPEAPPAVAPPPPAQVTTSGPTSRSTADEIPGGSLVEILDIGPEDPFAAKKKELLGKRCRVRGEALVGEEGYFTGRLRCGHDPEYFFTKLSVGLLEAAEVGPASQPGKPFEGEEVPPGTKVRILAFSKDDALFPWPKEMTTRADELLRRYGNLVGQLCEVVPETPLLGSPLGGTAPTTGPVSQPASAPAPSRPRGLVHTGEGWFGGTLQCNSQKIFVYQAAIEVL